MAESEWTEDVSAESEPVPDEPAAAEAELAPALEAILMVVSEPVPAAKLASVLGEPQSAVESALRELAAEYRGETGRPRGFALREVAGGWRIYSAPRYADVVASFVTSGQSARLSGPALETLAVIAYRQPVTRAQVAQIRGVNVDGVVRTLATRGLIEERGTEPTGAVTYGTTGYFLERMGMSTLAELPPMAPHLPELDQLDDVERDNS